MADVFEQILAVLVTSAIYILIGISLPLALYHVVEKYYPWKASEWEQKMAYHPAGRVVLIIIRFAFVINIIIAFLLFYFLTWWYILAVV